MEELTRQVKEGVMLQSSSMLYFSLLCLSYICLTSLRSSHVQLAGKACLLKEAVLVSGICTFEEAKLTDCSFTRSQENCIF